MLQTKGLRAIEPISKPFLGAKSWQILPFSAKNGQKCGRKTGFSRAILLKRVKSGGSCQAVIGGEIADLRVVIRPFFLSVRSIVNR
jgi:hypothetical protein